MNQLSVLMHLLTKKEGAHQLGASQKEILKTLNITHKNKASQFSELISNLAEYVEPLGLHVSYNPLDDHWFLTHDSDVSEMISANPFEGKPKLAATLLCVLVSSMKRSGKGSLAEIKELRKKKHVMRDLDELERQGYVKIDSMANIVKLTPLIGYQLDLEKLFLNLSLELRE